MPDIYSKKKRSDVMSKVSSAETGPEKQVRKLLFSKGFRYRKNVKYLPGKPDIVLPKFKTVILVHGCFWHGHKKCKAAKLPETRKDFWKKKIESNTRRDKRNMLDLKKLGWKVIIVWQCEMSSKLKLAERLELLIGQIKK
jgi:DNA mismatch endonuclease, patch repair protein